MSKVRIEQEKLLLKAYDEMYPSLSVQGKVMGASDAVINDSIHDIFLDLLEKKTVLEKVNNFKAYIGVSFRRKIAKALNRSFSELDENQVKSESSYETFLIKSQGEAAKSMQLQKALNSLSPGQRKVIVLRFYEGLSYEEIAEKESCTIRTVYNQFHSAMKVLRQNKLISSK